ncbi:uncharacterized protein BJ212DRAFT_347695 [Suillus subaureus]|uniref:F-box domain-containing protein n=1 Tax=Suillus subaureus TaxID=48587 RepID=A0A9P7E8U7_9AGAM|nr:uncharacterized protein BJ212DRAFT_347695 [Suillus subaureus]KAG1814697.1 hypothetical protein BJ212DRAFT_347695 [Suillus subaureus]
MKSKVELLSLPEELLLYILSFLPWQDILRCTSLCKVLRQAYISSSELQYITELGGQQLLPVFGGYVSFSKRLQFLRDKAHAWFKFDIHSFEAISIPAQFCTGSEVTIANGYACFWKPTMYLCKIFPMLPKALQQTIERDFSPDSLCSVPKQKQSDFDVLNVFIDPVQNLLAIAYVTVIRNGNMVYDEEYYIDLIALDGDGTHPQAAGRTLFLSDLPTRENFITKSTKIEGFGRYIALRLFDDQSRTPAFTSRWWLQIWDWQHSTTSNSILSGPIIDPDFDEIDICFLGNNRFLIVNDNLKLYSIEDMSQAPLLLACFSLPVSFMNLQCFTPTDDIARSSHSQTQAPQVTWISNPKHRLLSFVTRHPDLYFVISTRIFFEPNFVDSKGTATIPWESWGPSNARAFPHRFLCKLAVSGNRALYALAIAGAKMDDSGHSTEYRLHLMDFSPSAVKRHHQQGLGRMVNEPSTVEHVETKECITTSMPYVEVVSDKTISHGELIEMWLDSDKLYLLKSRFDTDKIDQFEVIEF